jgi:hypothetical protein
LGSLLLAGAGVAVLAGIVVLALFGGLLLVGIGLLASGIAAGTTILRHFLGRFSSRNEENSSSPDTPEPLPKWQDKRVGEIIDVEEAEVTLLRDDDSRAL